LHLLWFYIAPFDKDKWWFYIAPFDKDKWFPYDYKPMNHF